MYSLPDGASAAGEGNGGAIQHTAYSSRAIATRRRRHKRCNSVVRTSTSAAGEGGCGALMARSVHISRDRDVPAAAPAAVRAALQFVSTVAAQL